MRTQAEETTSLNPKSDEAAFLESLAWDRRYTRWTSMGLAAIALALAIGLKGTLSDGEAKTVLTVGLLGGLVCFGNSLRHYPARQAGRLRIQGSISFAWFVVASTSLMTAAVMLLAGVWLLRPPI